jgi:hypothetical protein
MLPVFSDFGLSGVQVQTTEIEAAAAASFQPDTQSYLDFYTSKVLSYYYDPSSSQPTRRLTIPIIIHLY